MQQLFQSATQTQNPNDQFIKWCTKSLNGLNDSIDGEGFHNQALLLATGLWAVPSFRDLSTFTNVMWWCAKPSRFYSIDYIIFSIVVPTFISFLRDVESPYEVQDYVKQYLGESAKSAQFAKEFLEKRSTINKQKQARHDEVSTPDRSRH